jgi:hypothetical protein
MLVAFVRQGLANRLRLLASAERVARHLDQPFALYWPSREECGCAFGDLFENDVRQMTDQTMAGFGPAVLYTDDRIANRTHYLVQDLIARQHNAPHIVIYSCGFVGFVDEAVGNHDSQLPAAFRREMVAYHRALRPLAQLRERVERFAAEAITPPTVGVHVRRNDHQWSRARSTNERFFLRMDQLVRQDDRTTFLLATDCPQTERLFIDRFNGRVTVYPKRVARAVTTMKAPDRATVEGVQDALIDILLLARTSRVLGSYGSTFSRAVEYFSGDFRKLEVM